MKKIFLALMVFTILASSASAKSVTVIRDKRGNYNGKLIQQGNKVYKYDKHNNHSGSYKIEGKKVYSYDKRGNHESTYKVED